MSVEEDEETGESVDGAAQHVARLAPEQVQRNQHKRVADTHQQVGTERKQRPMQAILGLPLALVMMVMLTLVVAPTVALVMGFVVMMTGDDGGFSRGSLGGVFVDLALKDQGSDPDGLDYREDERCNEACDECRK